MAQALRAQQAWDRKLYVESGEQSLLDAVDRCLGVIGDPDMHNAGKGSAVAELSAFLRDGLRKARGER
jgi:isoaspartyl peptidase/L-asparaginase-like protein (Ntn-hydrolase superfamily)